MTRNQLKKIRQNLIISQNMMQQAKRQQVDPYCKFRGKPWLKLIVFRKLK